MLSQMKKIDNKNDLIDNVNKVGIYRFINQDLCNYIETNVHVTIVFTCINCYL